jgi:CheY-like chemotaxis protein
VAAPSKQDVHILVVNDVPALLDLFRDLLEDEGYQVTLDSFVGAELTEQLGRVKATGPDLVVLDFLVGGELLGWQLLEAMKLDPATVRIPVVVCTAAVETVKELEGHLASMGVEAILKPFDLDQLLAAIERALKRVTAIAHRAEATESA